MAGGIPALVQFQTRCLRPRPVMPSFSAMTDGPPAASMIAFDISGVIPPCTALLNRGKAMLYPKRKKIRYRADVVTELEIMEYAFALAKSKGISNVAIAKACQVSRAAPTNWKNTEKKIPPR